MKKCLKLICVFFVHPSTRWKKQFNHPSWNKLVFSVETDWSSLSLLGNRHFILLLLMERNDIQGKICIYLVWYTFLILFPSNEEGWQICFYTGERWPFSFHQDVQFLSTKKKKLFQPWAKRWGRSTTFFLNTLFPLYKIRFQKNNWTKTLHFNCFIFM